MNDVNVAFEEATAPNSQELAFSYLHDDLKIAYQDLIVKGPLATYFQLVEGGFFDAAQAVTANIKTSVLSFEDKITEILSDSDALAFVTESVEEAAELLLDMKETLDQLKAQKEAMAAVEKAKEEASAEEEEPEEVRKEDVPETGAAQ